MGDTATGGSSRADLPFRLTVHLDARATCGHRGEIFSGDMEEVDVHVMAYDPDYDEEGDDMSYAEEPV